MRTSLADVNCSIARSMEVIGDGWTALILRDVYCGITRFEQLTQDLDVSRKILAARLDRLVADGILERRAYSEHPPRHDYVLTRKGRDLQPVFLALMAWGDRWTAGPEGPPAQTYHEACGQHVRAVVTCDHCGKPLTPDDAIPEAGPGGRVGRGTRLLGPLLAARARARRRDESLSAQ
jgi:DNA-binding HxlR family transcriptional regulator